MGSCTPAAAGLSRLLCEGGLLLLLHQMTAECVVVVTAYSIYPSVHCLCVLVEDCLQVVCDFA
jgi:hypothetical protein